LLASSSNLATGNNQFQLSLAPGAYILKVNGNGYTYAQRVISQSASINPPIITFIGNEKPINSQPQKAKNGGGSTSMLYTVGDQLLYKGISGNYATIVADKPTESKTVDFYFIECKDADDNYYPVVIIGSQIWMAENLKTTSYRTGEGVSNVSLAASWASATYGAWTDYDNLESNGTKYGHLYNYYAATDPRNISPVGWRVPTDAEWTTLTTYLGGANLAGGKLKQTGTTNWNTPNIGATNETGFSGIGAGNRSYNGTFEMERDACYWWTTTESNSSYAWNKELTNSYSNLGGSAAANNKKSGFSIRCLSDVVFVIPPTLTTTTAASSITVCGNHWWQCNPARWCSSYGTRCLLEHKSKSYYCTNYQNNQCHWHRSIYKYHYWINAQHHLLCASLCYQLWRYKLWCRNKFPNYYHTYTYYHSSYKCSKHFCFKRRKYKQ